MDKGRRIPGGKGRGVYHITCAVRCPYLCLRPPPALRSASHTAHIRQQRLPKPLYRRDLGYPSPHTHARARTRACTYSGSLFSLLWVVFWSCSLALPQVEAGETASNFSCILVSEIPADSPLLKSRLFRFTMTTNAKSRAHPEITFIGAGPELTRTIGDVLRLD